MSAFVLRFKSRGRPNRARSEETVERPSIVVGSRPLADLYVPDRMVAGEALRLSFDGYRVTAAVMSELAGVFVDGVPLYGQAEVPDGATVQIGHAAIEVSVDREALQCVLVLNEGHLPTIVDGLVKRVKPEKPFALEEGGAQERLWGKSPVMRRLNAGALLFGVALLAAFPWLRNAESMGGPLSAAHRPGAVEDGPRDCAACHSPFSSDYDPKCAECHEGFVDASRHPYELVGDVSCSECHREHVGHDNDLMPSDAALCGNCHEQKDLAGLDTSRALESARAEAGAAAATPVPYDGFSHADHLDTTPRGRVVASRATSSDKLPIDCRRCHVRQPDGDRDFARVSYESCLECHADWRVGVHGRDQEGVGCLSCHAKPVTGADFAREIKTVSVPATSRRWVLTPRAHDFSPEECRDCHVLGRRDDGTRTSVAEHVFRHDHHLPTVTPASGGERALAAACATCHASVADSETLGGTPLVDTSWTGVATTGCVSCHTDGDPVAVESDGPARTLPDMFHRIHAVDPAEPGASRGARESLTRGCLSCHLPVVGEARMELVPGAQDCSACHTGHENVGGGKCAACHVDPATRHARPGRTLFRRSGPGVFDATKRPPRADRPQERFDHASRGHDSVSCEDCHDVEALTRVERVAAARLPEPDADVCIRCHLEQRYHR